MIAGADKIRAVPRPLTQPHSHTGSVVLSPRGLFDVNARRVYRVSCTAAPIHAASQAIRMLGLWHLASLDAPTVALTWSWALAWTVHIRLPLWIPILLPLAVWPIYVVDRILDARAALRSISLKQLRERHLFHWRHRSILVPLASASALAAAWIIFHLMPHKVRMHDSVLAAASLVYFTRVHTGRRILPLLSKEFLVGVLFTLGCALPTWSRIAPSQTASWLPLLVSTLFFALLAWLNCFAIDRWESQGERPARSPVSTLALGVAAAASICSLLLSASSPRSTLLLACGAIAALLLAVLDRSRSRLSPVTLRAAADLVLLTPALLLAFAPILLK